MVPAVQMQNLQRESKFLTVSTCKYVSHLCSSVNPVTCALDQDIRMHKLRPQCASVHTQAMNAVLALYCKHYWEGEGDRADAVFSKVFLLRTDSTMFSRFQRFTAIPWSAVLRCRQIRKSSHLSPNVSSYRCPGPEFPKESGG